MVTPELKWPTTNLTPSPTNLLATDTPCFGSDTSSPTLSSIFWPMMPPAALMSSAACSAPFFSCAPKAAFGPVSGPATPILIWACALPAKASASAERQTRGRAISSYRSPLLKWPRRSGRWLEPPTASGAIDSAKTRRKSRRNQARPVPRELHGLAAPAQNPARALIQRYCARHLADAGCRGSRASRAIRQTIGIHGIDWSDSSVPSNRAKWMKRTAHAEDQHIGGTTATTAARSRRWPGR